MSFGNSYNGGRTRYATKVFLNIYDLMPANEYLYPIGMGFHHSGVEISGVEYSFASGAGIFDSSTPKTAPNAIFREQIEMGSFDGGKVQVQRALDELRDSFGPDDYNLIRRNCNHFANALCWKLLQKTIPGYVNRLADVGRCCSCLLPRQLLEHAPVGDNSVGTSGASSAQENRPFLVRAGRSENTRNQGSLKAFSGTGAQLGGSSSASDEKQGLLSRLMTQSSSGGGSSPKDELTDRREKARKAALARLELNQQKKN